MQSHSPKATYKIQQGKYGENFFAVPRTCQEAGNNTKHNVSD